MRNLKLTVRYDGTDFFGWQTQPNARTVQQTLEGAIAAITRGGDPAPAGFDDVAPLATGGTVLPGLIELHNQTERAGHFIAFQLQGTRSNRDAVGARIAVACGGRVRGKGNSSCLFGRTVAVASR